MTVEEEFQAAANRALIENTAQDIFNILKDLENQASLHASRWIWELLQNARDAAKHLPPVKIEVHLEHNQLIFRHNGAPFTMDQVAHLIFHGSTKQREDELIGRFGTGFLSTHILSRKPELSGQLSDGRMFRFVLDRQGNSPEELTASMRRSEESFKASIRPDSLKHEEFTTEFVYPLEPSSLGIAEQGVKSLTAFTAYVLAFNHEVESISITHSERPLLFRRGIERPARDGIRLIPISRSSTGSATAKSFRVAISGHEDVSVAVLAHRGPSGVDIAFGPEVPRLFMAFPLFGTETFSLPGVVNSRRFRPKKDRDGLYLGIEDQDYNRANKALIEKSLPQLISLLKFCAERRWKGVEQLCNLKPQSAPRGVDGQWLQDTIKAKVITPLREAPLLRSLAGDLVKPKDAWIPVGSTGATSVELWKLAGGQAESERHLVDSRVLASWEEVVRGWAAQMGLQVEQLFEALTLQKIAQKTSALGSLSSIGASLREGTDPLGWLNTLISLLFQDNQSSVLDQLTLLPNQKGLLRKRTELHRDDGIDEELKTILEMLEIPVRDKLLHAGATSERLESLLPAKSQSDVLATGLTHLRQVVAKPGGSERSADANAKLLAWILNKGSFESLEGFPALTDDRTDSGLRIHLSLKAKAENPETVPLAPPGCWPDDAGRFADLFPKRSVLSMDYFAACPVLSVWAEAGSKGFFRVGPLWDAPDEVRDFLIDEGTEGKDRHKSVESVLRSNIAFLRERNVGIMETVRKSKSKCVAFLKFVAGHVIRADPRWAEVFTARCDCGKDHECQKAAWLTPLRENKWVHAGGSPAEHVSAESLAGLLKDEPEIISLLANGDGPLLLKKLGVSTGAFLITSLATDEDTRVTLSRSLVELFHAVGDDSNKIASLAAELASHPETLQHIQERRAAREKVRRNQSIGKAVEEALEAALSSGYGLKVDRTGVGSDYSVEADHDYLDEGGHEVLLRAGRFLIEIKATTGYSVRMTDVQGRTAGREAERFVLCVVPLDHTVQPDPSDIISRSRFVFDVGRLVAPLVSSLESFDEAKREVVRNHESVELEIEGESVGFRVYRAAWESGLSFEDSVKRFGGIPPTEDAASTSPVDVAD